MSKVIDFVSRLKTVEKVNHFKERNHNEVEILQFEKEKKKLLFQERRNAKRTLLSEFISAMIVLPEKGLIKVLLYDISEEGVSFELELEQGQFKVGEEILLRVYLNQKTYFPLTVSVKHMTPDVEAGVVRHGAEFLKGQANDVALQHFVKFIELAGTDLKKDSGDFVSLKSF